jgi:phage shock protein PspC (stress-responsive transcriptional regulator)
MRRSFTERVFAGVVGGMAPSLRVNVWVLRALWLGLGLASGGVVLLWYLALWWWIPQETLFDQRRQPAPLWAGLTVLLALGLAAALWLGVAVQPVFWSAVGMALALAFLWRQIRG